MMRGGVARLTRHGAYLRCRFQRLKFIIFFLLGNATKRNRQWCREMVMTPNSFRSTSRRRKQYDFATLVGQLMRWLDINRLCFTRSVLYETVDAARSLYPCTERSNKSLAINCNQTTAGKDTSDDRNRCQNAEAMAERAPFFHTYVFAAEGQ